LCITVTIIAIRRKCSSINQPSSANHCCYCVLHRSSCLPEQGLLRPRNTISGLPNPKQSKLSQTNLYPGGTASNCKHPTLCFLTHNTRPLTSQTYHGTATRGGGNGKDKRRRLRHLRKRQQSAAQERPTAPGAKRGTLHSPRTPHQRKRYGWRPMYGVMN
jgi:hypothetical protein